MKAIFFKELKAFFNSTVGYILLGLFITLNGLLLWLFDGDVNIFNNGYANLSPFFYNCAWIFVFLFPAITMKSFADEYKSGTLEILKTLPLTNTDIVLGKFFAFLSITALALLPSLIYLYSLYQLGNPIGNIDFGIAVTGYISLILLASSYIAIGMYSSILAKNTISAFLIAICINAFLYFGVEAIASLLGSKSYTVAQLGMEYHFNSLGRGVVDLRALIYFIGLTFIFIFSTQTRLKNEK